MITKTFQKQLKMMLITTERNRKVGTEKKTPFNISENLIGLASRITSSTLSFVNPSAGINISSSSALLRQKQF